jgi:copper chaperone CopZ
MQGVPTSSTPGEEVNDVKKWLMGLEGVKTVEVMMPRKRHKLRFDCSEPEKRYSQCELFVLAEIIASSDCLLVLYVLQDSLIMAESFLFNLINNFFLVQKQGSILKTSKT